MNQVCICKKCGQIFEVDEEMKEAIDMGIIDQICPKCRELEEN